MKIKTSELTGAALDWAVANAQGMSWWTVTNAVWDNNLGCTDWILDRDGVLKKFYFDGSRSRSGHWEANEMFSPSTDWSQGGPILTEAKISRTIDHSGLWIAFYGFNYDDAKEHMQCDRDELVAGLRCYVAIRLGDEVDIPKELLI